MIAMTKHDQELSNLDMTEVINEQPRVELHLGDCLEIMTLLKSQSIDLILTDPPYGIDFCSNWTNRKERLQNDDLNGWLALMKRVLPEFKRILNNTGVCCCCGGGGKTPVTAMFTMEVIKHFNLIQTLVWKKFIGLGWRYRPAYENILVFSKDKDNYNFYNTTRKCSNLITGINQDVPRYNGNKRGGEDDHPTQKPVALMRKLLSIHSQPGHMVCDPFMGSGTTGVACIEMDCNFIGIEIEERYYNIAKKRILQEASQGRFEF